MSFNFSMSFKDDEFDHLRDYYNADSTSEVKNQVRDEMKNHILETTGFNEDDNQ